jgi:hypothetical protein
MATLPPAPFGAALLCSLRLSLPAFPPPPPAPTSAEASHVGLAGPSCPDGGEAAAVPRLAAQPSPDGSRRVTLAVCRYVSGDRAGAAKELQGARGKEADNMLLATLFLAESTADDAKAALGLDESRRESLLIAATLAGAGHPSEAMGVRSTVKMPELLPADRTALLRARLDFLNGFVTFVAKARPDSADARRSRSYMADLLRPRPPFRCRASQ